MITFDQWLDIICRVAEHEDGFEIQANIHAVSAMIDEWKAGNISNAQIIAIFNLDNSDPELITVKTHLDGLTRAQALALQSAMIGCELEISVAGITYNKSLLRTRFGL